MKSIIISAVLSPGVMICALALVGTACPQSSSSSGKGPDLSKRVDALIESRLPMLERQNLHLSGEKLNDAELAAILADARVPILSILDVGDNQLTAAAMGTIAKSAKTAELRWLVLSNNPIGDKGIEALASSGCLGTITFLGLVAVGATDRGARVLAGARLPAIETLQMGWQTLGDSGARALAGLPALKKLDLIQGQITGDGARTLLASARVEHVILAENPWGAGSLSELKALSSQLRTVDLAQTGLGATDMAALARLPLALENLDIAHCAVGDEGLLHLAGAPWLAKLQSLDASSTGATPATREQLHKAWGQRAGLTIER